MKHPVVVSNDGVQAPEPVRTAVVQVDTLGRVVYCNALSQQLVLGQSSLGRMLREVLHAAEKFGRIPIGTGEAIMRNLAQDQSRFELSDGRPVLMNCSYKDDGATLIEWWELSDFVAAARAVERDPLTGLLSRASMIAHIAAVSAVAQQERQRALLVLHIDWLQGLRESLALTTVEKLL